LISIGEKQKYGSQFECVEGEGWLLQPVDPTITDAERAEVDIEPLADKQAKMAELTERTENNCSFTAETIKIMESVMEGTP